MNSISKLFASCIGLTVGYAAPAIAQSNTYYAGQATGGQSVVVDLDSIYSIDRDDTRFIYFFAGEPIPSQAHCAGGGAWTTLDDGIVRTPQSQATRNMLNVVCSYSTYESAAPSVVSRQAALVNAPPSNIRATPNGRILCTIRTRSYIDVYGYSAGWYSTDACSQAGVIHESQVQF
ncbi:hypothetical protein S7335_5137 [Synechococcus sp. PCC 7335]|uniref:hypothetical protein n=1 Tax=Synechococcus sp. (strain ATCC 29403 / PCC 7335) TaxID=91464 RepID=UPI00017EB0A0|nr:hypothetical protein [Synechococcus sp. PCC 7335]EDX87427.1 hypothetical protein S7335_5137 [Synechococcus sp. PCC 7335]